MHNDIFDYKTQTETVHIFSLEDALNNLILAA